MTRPWRRRPNLDPSRGAIGCKAEDDEPKPNGGDERSMSSRPRLAKTCERMNAKEYGYSENENRHGAVTEWRRHRQLT